MNLAILGKSRLVYKKHTPEKERTEQNLVRNGLKIMCYNAITTNLERFINVGVDGRKDKSYLISILIRCG